MKLGGICLLTCDAYALAEFYSKVFSEKATGEDNFFEFSEYGIQIFKDENTATDNSESKNFVIWYKVEDVDKEYERLSNLGLNIVSKPKTYDYGYREMSISDPDGNTINIVKKIG